MGLLGMAGGGQGLVGNGRRMGLLGMAGGGQGLVGNGRRMGLLGMAGGGQGLVGNGRRMGLLGMAGGGQGLVGYGGGWTGWNCWGVNRGEGGVTEKNPEEKQSGMKCFSHHDADEECDALVRPLSITVCV